jgi:predicted O-methyltransferase YrrM
MRKFIKLIFGKEIYEVIKILFYSLGNLRNLKCIFYNRSNDLNYNIDVFNSLGFDLEKIKSDLANNGLEYLKEDLSWQHHIFLGLKKEKMNILEIGTHDGSFTSFLSKNYATSNIFTIDLNENNETFLTTYSRENKDFRNEFLKKRKINLSYQNIRFDEMDSIHLINKFEKEYFDLIFIDGDHLNPQVTIDLFSSILLLKKNGIMCCDDIILNSYKKNYISNESYVALDMLEKKGLIKNFFIVKRIRKYNAVLKKYISISYKQ